MSNHSGPAVASCNVCKFIEEQHYAPLSPSELEYGRDEYICALHDKMPDVPPMPQPSVIVEYKGLMLKSTVDWKNYRR